MEFSSQTIFDIIFGTWLSYVFWLLILAIILLIARLIIRKVATNSKHFDHAVFLIRLPKEKSGDSNGEMPAQEMQEEIARAETIFSTIGGLRAQRSFMAWLLGRNDHYSFEIVANKNKIAFYIVTPRESARYIEQQIHAYYPSAAIEEVKDYNIFHSNLFTTAGTLTSRRNDCLPLKTYIKMENDPMNSLISVMSKLEENEGLAIQYIARSAKASWHTRARTISSKVRGGETIAAATKSGVLHHIGKAFNIITHSFKSPNANEQQFNNQDRLTVMEEDMLKGIEEKNSKAGLDVNLRIIVSAKNQGKASAYLDNLGSAFSQYNFYEYGNSFRNKIRTKGHKKTIYDFIYRRFDSSLSFLLNTEELAGLFHFPLRTAETPNILWLMARHAAAPADTPTEGISLGTNYYRGEKREIRIKREDRRRHHYIIGKSGVGKSVTLGGMIVQDIYNGEGVCVIDPHGDLIDDVLERIPPERAEDVILFSPSDFDRPLALNLLEYDSRYPEQKTFVINEMIKIFDKLYDLKATGGPIFEQYVRNAMLLIMDDPSTGSTLMEIPKVLADADFRKMKLDNCKDQTVVDFWRKEAEKAGGDAALANIVPYVTSKLTQFISNDTMRPIIGQQNSSFNVRDVMDRQKILLVNLSKGQIGEMNSHLLGMIIVGKILMAALSRTDIAQEARKDFYLYIDEFQNFTTDSICAILSEARKYGLNLIIAHQYLGQLIEKGDTTIRDAVFGNVGTWMLFKIGSDDAEVMEKEFAPVFNSYDLINIEKYTAYIKLLIDNTSSRPFSVGTTWPLPGIKTDGIAKKVKTLSRLKYGQDRRMVEAEIKKRMVI